MGAFLSRDNLLKRLGTEISLFMDDRYSKKQLFQCHTNDSLTIDDQPLHQKTKGTV